jgi:hypothetical protein
MNLSFGMGLSGVLDDSRLVQNAEAKSRGFGTGHRRHDGAEPRNHSSFAFHESMYERDLVSCQNRQIIYVVVGFNRHGNPPTLTILD